MSGGVFKYIPRGLPRAQGAGKSNPFNKIGLWVGLLLVPGLAGAWPCATSFTTYSQSLTSMNVSCAPVIQRNAVRLNCSVYHQTTDYTCGPATAMMLMRCYGMLGAGEMNRSTELKIATEMGTVKGEGTTQYQMAVWLENHGFDVSYGDRITSGMIIDNLKKGIPTLLGFSNHWMLAEGYNPGTAAGDDEIIFVDSDHNINVIPGNVIDKMWAELQLSLNKTFLTPGTYIIAVPKK